MDFLKKLVSLVFWVALYGVWIVACSDLWTTHGGVGGP